MAGRHIGSNPTENRAIGRAGGDEDAEELRRRQMLREQADAARNARLRRARERAQKAADESDGGDAA